MKIFRIKAGREIIDALTEYCQEHEIKAGWVSVIGAFERAGLAYFDPRNQRYSEKILKQQLEIAVLSGTISTCQTKLHFHLHAVLGNRNFQSFSGHLKEGIVNPTAEVAIWRSPQRLSRFRDPKTGLDLLA
jgi:hypothetical protein